MEEEPLHQKAASRYRTELWGQFQLHRFPESGDQRLCSQLWGLNVTFGDQTKMIKGT